jgi:rubredoxin
VQTRPIEFVEYQSLFAPNVLELHTSYCEIGVGVYQGEAVGIRQLVMADISPHWGIYKLKRSEASHIDVEVVKKLRCLACQLEYDIQFYLWKKDSRKQNEIEPAKLCQFYQLHPQPSHQNKDGESNAAIQIPPETEPNQSPQYLKCRECPYTKYKDHKTLLQPESSRTICYQIIRR